MKSSQNDLAAKRLREDLRQLARRLQIDNQSEAGCCGLGISHCHALVEVGRKGSLSVNDLAQTLRLDKSTISRTINNLVEQDLIIRESDPSDRRYVDVKLSPQGEKAFNFVEATMESYYLRVLEAIPEDRREQVLESLELLLSVVPIQCC